MMDVIMTFVCGRRDIVSCMT